MNNNRIVYVNGEYLPESEAKVSVFDRGFLFADAVYEVTSVVQGRMLDNAAHLVRLQRSLRELSIALPLPLPALVAAQEETIQRNQLQEGLLYLQISRGVADRDFALPVNIPPTFILFTQAKQLLHNPQVEKGLRVITQEDIRWQRRDIKTVALLASSLAKQAALDAGADDAWLVTDGMVNEGSSNNAFIITHAGQLLTRPLSHDILHGITRAAILRLAKEHGLLVEERAFSVQEAYAAREAFITSATSFALPVVSIDGHLIADGKPGPLALRLRQLYLDAMLAAA